jgi:hypothetical protein
MNINILCAPAAVAASLLTGGGRAFRSNLLRGSGILPRQNCRTRKSISASIPSANASKARTAAANIISSAAATTTDRTD